ncbi:MAG: pilus assembly FimT family protein [Candidatus Acidiferrales bacterium]
MNPQSKSSAHRSAKTAEAWCARIKSRGFTLLELLFVIAVGTILTAVAIPIMNTALNNMHVNSVVDAITGAVSKTRYQSIMTSQPYTMTITAPANTYVATNVGTGVATTTVPIPLPSQTVQINSGTTATYTYTFCPNGTVYGAGGVCPGAGLPPVLTVSLQGRQVNINVSSVGNVSTTLVQ